MRHVATIVLVSLITFARPARAQLSEAQPGARVRLEAPGVLAGTFDGTVLSRTADTLSVGGPHTLPINIPIDRLTSLEVSRGSSRMLGAQHGAYWGAAIGLLLGIAALPGDNCAYCDSSSGEQTSMVLSVTLAGAFYGAGIGAMIGREKWERYELGPRPTLGLRAGKPSVGVNIQF